jgi:RNA polymerase sigma-70 factor (ECF subfamily)
MAGRPTLSLPTCIVVRRRRWPWHHRRGVTAADLMKQLGERDVAELAEPLAAGLAEIRARWPSAPEPGDALVARVAASSDLAGVASRLPDLFLAWWAGTGDSAGIAAFEAAFAADVDRLIARFRELSADDLRQRLRIKLFVGTGSTAPKIRDYTGAGSLAGWLRVTAARAFVDAAREHTRRRAEVELDEADVLGLVVPGGTLHDRAQRAELGAAIKHAFAESVSRLSPRERTFLRHATVDALTLDQIAATYQVHRATVARTLKSARERLLAETRDGVVARLGIAPDQLASALAMLDSKLDLSLSAVLRSSTTLSG